MRMERNTRIEGMALGIARACIQRGMTAKETFTELRAAQAQAAGRGAEAILSAWCKAIRTEAER